MKSTTITVADVDAYIDSFPPATKKMLAELRSVIIKAAPGAQEVISYNMPAYKLNGILVYFAGYEHHIGFYPLPSAILFFKKELSVYKSAKGSVQFPLDKPLPEALIKKIVSFRKKENQEKQSFRSKKN